MKMCSMFLMYCIVEVTGAWMESKNNIEAYNENRDISLIE